MNLIATVISSMQSEIEAAVEAGLRPVVEGAVKRSIAEAAGAVGVSKTDFEGSAYEAVRTAIEKAVDDANVEDKVAEIVNATVKAATEDANIDDMVSEHIDAEDAVKEAIDDAIESAMTSATVEKLVAGRKSDIEAMAAVQVRKVVEAALGIEPKAPAAEQPAAEVAAATPVAEASHDAQ